MQAKAVVLSLFYCHIAGILIACVESMYVSIVFLLSKQYVAADRHGQERNN